MKFIFVSCFLSLTLINVHSQTSTNSVDEKTFLLGNFHLESDVTLPNAFIKYVTYGSLNIEKSNGILLPSFFTSDYRGYNAVIGSGNALDTTKYFLILSELFANGHSSSPSNTPAPFNGPLFPFVSIRDNVNATYALVTKQFQLRKLKSVIGFSMGAEQAECADCATGYLVA